MIIFNNKFKLLIIRKLKKYREYKEYIIEYIIYTTVC
jgi:hypothetical protein